MRRLLVVINFITLLATVAMVAFAIRVQRDVSLDFARRNVATLAATTTEHSRLLFRTINGGLRAMERDLRIGIPFQSAAEELRLVVDVTGVVRVGPENTLVEASPGFDETFIRGEIISKARERASGEIIGRPILMPHALPGENTEWVVPVRYHMADGDWLVAFLDLSALEKFYSSLGLGLGGVVGLARRDGVPIARFPSIDLSRDVSSSPLVVAIKSKAQSAEMESVSTLDGIHRVTAFRGLDEFNVAAYVGMSMDVVAEFWKGPASGLAGAGSMLIAVIVSLSIGVDFIFRRRVAAEKREAIAGAVMTTLLERAADGLFAVDASRAIVAANPAAARLLGVDPAALIGRDASSCLPPGPARAALFEKESSRRQIELPTAGVAAAIPVVLTVTDAGETGLRVVTLHDRTEDIARAEHLAVLEKMRVIGQMTGGVAHDFNNILTIISLNLELVGGMIEESPIWENHLLPALRASKRGAQLTGHLLAFARRQPLAPEAVNLAVSLAEFKSMMARSLGERWRIEIVHTATWSPLADAGQLETALVNLTINSRDAMVDGGRIVIETSDVAIDEAYAAEVGDLKPGDYIRIAVTDEGGGISPEVLERVFEPFFTTKPVGKGSGLGLSMVFGFAKQSNGHVSIYSEIDKGTTVKLYLPRAESEARSAGPAIINLGDPPHVRILVVEDDPDVRATAVRALRGVGQTTIEASNAEEATRLVDEGLEFDLLFTDVVLPGATGRQLADELRKRRPSLRVLFTSGYTENAIIHHGRLDPDVILLSKPYTREALREALRSVLSGI